MKPKRLLLPLALLVALVAAVQLLRQFVAERHSSAELMPSLESAFPKDTPVTIELQTPSATSELLTRRELRDQLRDWLLLAILTNSGFSPEQLNEVTFDLPPTRYGFLKGVGDWEFGEVRSRAVGNGIVIALIPANAGERRMAYLADIADQNRKNLGQRPNQFVIIEYDLATTLNAATLTRRETVAGETLFSEAAGYVERRVATFEEFEDFHQAIDDLTYAAIRDGALHLGGRRIPGRPIRNIKVADVAALWQAETKLTFASAEYESFVRQKEAELENRWKNVTYRTGDYAAEARLRRALEADQAGVAADVEAYRKQHGVADALGFSLDPAYDYEKMAQFVESNLGRLPIDPAKRRTDPSLPSFALDEALRRFSNERLQPTTLPGDEVARVAADLRKRSTRLLFTALQQLDGEIGEAFYGECEELFGLQAARYDGDLQYTEPGMVLFYTDLLAKLWALDFAGSAQQVAIEDFIPLTRVKLSQVYRTELDELRHTRLWFGPQNKGFQIAPNSEVFLARVATRLYAASATSLKQGEESAPNAQTASFLGWWDDHYEEVARFEPEYERLNAIMKWSLVLGWLHQNGALQSIAYFADVQVPRDRWFPDWVHQHSELRFRDWNRFEFFPKGAFGVTTEALPRLRSAQYELFGEDGHYLVGGVSLASRATFAERPLLSTRVAEGLRRANVRYSGTGANGFKTFEGVEYKLARNASRYEVSITPNAGMRLRGRVGELANQPMGRTLHPRAGGFEYRASAGTADIGSLSIRKTANGFRVGWASRDIDAGYALGRRLSTSGDIPATLARDVEVAASTRLSDGTYVARVRGSDRWVRLAEEEKVASKLEGEWQARVGGHDPHAKSVKMQWVEETWVKEQLGSDRFDALVGQMRARLTPSDELNALMAQRDLRIAAHRLATEPFKTRAQLEMAYRSDLAHADELTRAGHTAAASDHLGRMERLWGPTPDIAARRALAFADSNALGRSAQNADRVLAGSSGKIDGVYQELARRIARSAPRQQAETWDTLRAADEWTALRRSGRPAVAIDGDQLALEYHLAGDGVRAQAVPVQRAIRSDAAVYVQDSPQLRNLDWATDVSRTMRQAVDGDLAVVLRLPRTDVAHFRPAKIYAPEDVAVARRVRASSGSTARAAQNGYRSFDFDECDTDTLGSAATDCPDERQAVYVLVPKQGPRGYE
jgi:hypothetical protein